MRRLDESGLVVDKAERILCYNGRREVEGIELLFSEYRDKFERELFLEEHMKDTLQAGIEYAFQFRIPQSKTVPALYPEAQEFQEMPEVFATGFMVGLLEWACIQAIHSHLDWPHEQTVGTHINVSHLAATPPGLVVTVRVKLIEADGRRLVFEVEADDGLDVITKGTHERYIIDRERFVKKAKQKAQSANS